VSPEHGTGVLVHDRLGRTSARHRLGTRPCVARRASGTRLMFFSGAGFTEELRRVADRDPSVQLVGLERLYGGEWTGVGIPRTGWRAL